MSENQPSLPEPIPSPLPSSPDLQADSANSESAELTASAEEQLSASERTEALTTTPPAPVRSIPLIALPISSSQLLKKHGCSHPSLLSGAYASFLTLRGHQLDFQLKPENMHKIWQKTCHVLNQNAELKAEWRMQTQKRLDYLQQLQARQFQLQTLTPLRLESPQILGQTGLDLHPLYGFPYLPAARLKGLMRQYVESVWLPQQADTAQAQQKIDSLLGSPCVQGGQGGSLIIHDAWPETWPKVFTDLQACHHRPYYQRREAPGDWQIPELRYYLSLRPGTRFSFALSSSCPEAQADLDLAEQWLKAALVQLGYGSGRASGDGCIKAAHEETSSPHDIHFSTRLYLTTPGFYRGANQHSEDCQLRASSLRGLLRWWWRTLHSGCLPQRQLLLLENALWGNRGKKSAIRLELQPVKTLQVRRFYEQDLVKQLPPPDHPKTKPGLSYLTYGIRKSKENVYYLPAGTQWELKFSCQPASLVSGGEHTKINLSAEEVLGQAQAALWLLCQFGGSGQRMRRGLGCLQMAENLKTDLNQWLQMAENLREQCGFSIHFDENQCHSPSLHMRLESVELLTPWKNEWFALHLLGSAYQSFLQKYKHQAQKKALGLPRSIGEPVQGEFQASDLVQERYASPFFLHFARHRETDCLILRIIAFPSSHLPDREHSRQLLSEMLQYLHTFMLNQIETYPLEPALHLHTRERRIRAKSTKRHADQPTVTAHPHPTDQPSSQEVSDTLQPLTAPKKRPRRKKTEDTEQKRTIKPRAKREKHSERESSKAPPPVAARPVQAGDRVEAILLEERTKKGGWRALYSKDQLSGPIVNSNLVPSEKMPGETMTLIVHSVNRFEMAFRVPTAADEEKADKAKKKKKRA